MGGSCQGIRSPQSSHGHGHWQIGLGKDEEAGLDSAYKTKGDLIFSARRVRFTLFQAFLLKIRVGSTRRDGLLVSPKYRYRVGSQVLRHKLSHTSLFGITRDLAMGIGKLGNAPTPNPSPLIGLRKSTLRRESNAWLMIE